MDKEKKSSNKPINFGFLIAISSIVAVLAIGTSASFHGKSGTVVAQSDAQHENATGTATNENATGTTTNSTG